MKNRIVALLAAAAVILGLAAGCGLLDMPQLALKRMSEEVRRDGLKALEARLTGRALVKYSLAMKVRDYPLVRALADGDRAGDFSCRLERMERDGDRAEAFLTVSCAGLTGTVRVDMVRRNGGWMISDFGLGSLGLVLHAGGDGYAEA